METMNRMQKAAGSLQISPIILRFCGFRFGKPGWTGICDIGGGTGSLTKSLPKARSFQPIP
jgi:hypothetical protein